MESTLSHSFVASEAVPELIQIDFYYVFWVSKAVNEFKKLTKNRQGTRFPQAIVSAEVTIMRPSSEPVL